MNATRRLQRRVCIGERPLCCPTFLHLLCSSEHFVDLTASVSRGSSGVEEDAASSVLASKVDML